MASTNDPHLSSNNASLYPSTYNSKDVKDLQLLKSKLLANSSANKASICCASGAPPPPLMAEEHNNKRRSQLNLQTSPIHINYINENLDHRKHELETFNLTQQPLLINTPIQRSHDDESPTTFNNLAHNLNVGLTDDTALALCQLQITTGHPVGAGSIEDNHYAATMADKFAMDGGGKAQRHSAFYEGR